MAKQESKSMSHKTTDRKGPHRTLLCSRSTKDKVICGCQLHSAGKSELYLYRKKQSVSSTQHNSQSAQEREDKVGSTQHGETRFVHAQQREVEGNSWSASSQKAPCWA